MTKELNILGVKVNIGYSMKDAVQAAAKLAKFEKPSHICTTNPEFIVDAQDDKEFKDIINSCDLSLPDGVGIGLAEIYLKKVAGFQRNYAYPVKALFTGMSLLRYLWLDKKDIRTIPGVWFVSELCCFAAQNNITVSFVGGWPRDRLGRPLKGEHNIALSVAQKLSSRYPGLQVVYASSDLSHKESYDIRSRELINTTLDDRHADIMFVAFGHPHQEKWISRNKQFIHANLFVGVGGSFETLLASNSETIRGFTDKGYEWMYRLLAQPWRYKRILKALIIFPAKVFINSLRR